jgi:hypothetical protein
MMKRLILLLWLIIPTLVSAQETIDDREKLKEEIRKEIEEEREREKLEKELRDEILREEKDNKKRDELETEARRKDEIERLKQLKKEQGEKWKGASLELQAGVSIPLGSYSLVGLSSGNSTVGFTGGLGFTWHFFKYFGLGVSGTYTHNPFNEREFGNRLKQSFSSIVDVNASGNSIIDARLDFHIRFPFKKARFSLIPYLSGSFINVSSYRAIIVDGNNTEILEDSYPMYGNLALGLDLQGEYYLTDHSGIIVSAGFQYSSILITRQNTFSSEPFDVFLITPRVGYRYRF